MPGSYGSRKLWGDSRHGYIIHENGLIAAGTASCIGSPDPFGQGFAVGIVLRFELSAAVVHPGGTRIAHRLGRQRMHQKQARSRSAEDDDWRDRPEILAGLLLGPGGAPGRETLQAQAIVRSLMATVAAGTVAPLLEQDGLDADPEKLKIKRLRRGERRIHV